MKKVKATSVPAPKNQPATVRLLAQGEAKPDDWRERVELELGEWDFRKRFTVGARVPFMKGL